MSSVTDSGIRRIFGVGLLAGLVLWTASAWASPPQDMGECDVPYFQAMRWNTVTTISGENRILHFQKPTIRCPGGTTIRSDSVRVYEETQYYQLYGNVEFLDAESILTSDQAQYFSEQRRLVTAGNSVLTNLADSSVITGHTMTLIRGAEEGDEDLLTVQGGEPHATLYPAVQEAEEDTVAAVALPDESLPPDSAMAAPDPADAAQGSEGVVLDTTAAEAMAADTLPPDTLLPDMAAIPQDTTMAPDTAAAPAAVPETVPVFPDTTGVVAGIAAVAMGMIAVPADIAAVGAGIAAVATGIAAAAPDMPVVVPDTAAVAPEAAAADPDPAPLERGRREALPEDPAPSPQVPEAVAPETETEAPQADEEPVERIPYEIDARRFVLEGSDSFKAQGNVVVTRDSLNASSDSLEYAKPEGALFLRGNALVVTEDYALTADDIRLAIPQDEIREARATGDAVLEGQDLQLISPILTLFFSDGLLERLVAVRDAEADSVRAEMDDIAREQDRLRRGIPPPSVRSLGFTEFPFRPYALARDFALDGDSLEVLAPGEVINEVRAVGQARGESMGQDSLNAEDTPELISQDWLEGDTILAFFAEDTTSAPGPGMEETDAAGDPDAPPPDLEREGLEPEGLEPEGLEPDSVAEYRLERLVASGNARSMYRMAPSDSLAAEEPGQFAVHYVIGDVITILLNADGEAENMEVAGQTRGIHLEPLSRPGNVVDSTAVPDTAGLGPGGPGAAIDTMVANPDTISANPDMAWTAPRGPWLRLPPMELDPVRDPPWRRPGLRTGGVGG